MTIGPQGGTLTLSGTPSTTGVPLRLVVPPNALKQDVVIQVTELNTFAPPAPYVDESPIFDIQPAGLTFATPAKLTVPFSNVQGIIAPQLSIYASTDCSTFTRIGDSYINAGFLQGSMQTLGPLFAGYPRTAADNAACAADGGTP